MDEEGNIGKWPFPVEPYSGSKARAQALGIMHYVPNINIVVPKYGIVATNMTNKEREQMAPEEVVSKFLNPFNAIKDPITLMNCPMGLELVQATDEDKLGRFELQPGTLPEG